MSNYAEFEKGPNCKMPKYLEARKFRAELKHLSQLGGTLKAF